MDTQTKREREKAMVTKMIALYCRGNHGTKKGLLCPECEALTRYACERSDKCPFMETKTFCSNCKVHCYKPEMREKIRAVMRRSALPKALNVYIDGGIAGQTIEHFIPLDPKDGRDVGQARWI